MALPIIRINNVPIIKIPRGTPATPSNAVTTRPTLKTQS